jgi:hypothetical protein
MECILYPPQYNLIYNVSFLTAGSCIYALYNGHYYMSICPGTVFITSINYWSYPDYSWRRYLDMVCVKLALSYQIYKAYRSPYMLHYYILVFMAACMYPLGIYYFRKKQYWHSTYAHCLLHIIANIANVILYSGKIE